MPMITSCVCVCVWHGEQEDLQGWLTDARGRDEFVVRHGDETEVRRMSLCAVVRMGWQLTVPLCDKPMGALLAEGPCSPG